MITPPRRQPPRRVRVPLRDFDAPGFVGSPDHLSGGSPRAALPRPLPFPNLDRPQRPPWEGVLNPGALGDQFDLSGDVMDALMALLQRRYLGGRAE